MSLLLLLFCFGAFRLLPVKCLHLVLLLTFLSRLRVPKGLHVLGCRTNKSMPGVVTVVYVLLCFIDPRVMKIRNEASKRPGIFSRTLRFYCVASSSGSLLPHLLGGHRKLVGRSAI